MKHFFLSSIVVLSFLTGCTRQIPDQKGCEPSQTLPVLSFSTKDEFLEALKIANTRTKSEDDGLPGLEDDLLIEVSDIDIYDDPIISIDCEDYIGTGLIENENLTLYEAAGYDTLIPNLNLARLLNSRAEVIVCDTMYKISSRGTYYFESSLEDYFNDHYAELNASTGIQIDSSTYLVADGIYRYDSYGQSEYDYAEHDPSIDDDEDEDEDEDEDNPNTNSSTKAASNSPQLSSINWARYPSYNTDAITWLGRVIQSTIGGNHTYYYTFNNRKRFAAKLYYYNYVFYSESGIVTTTQKRT